MHPIINSGCGAMMVLCLSACGNAPAGPQMKPAGNPNTAVAAKHEPLPLPLVNPAIAVQKAARRLLLYSDGHVIRTYKIGLGLSPVGDKVHEGDRRKPEGEFYIFVKNAKSNF